MKEGGMMGLFKKKIVIRSYEMESKKPVIKASGTVSRLQALKISIKGR